MGKFRCAFKTPRKLEFVAESGYSHVASAGEEQTTLSFLLLCEKRVRGWLLVATSAVDRKNLEDAAADIGRRLRAERDKEARRE